MTRKQLKTRLERFNAAVDRFIASENDKRKPRVITGTNWPFVWTIKRSAIGRKRPVWVVSQTCNGECLGTYTFRTLKEARIHFDAMMTLGSERGAL